MHDFDVLLRGFLNSEKRFEFDIIIWFWKVLFLLKKQGIFQWYIPINDIRIATICL